MTNVKPLTRKHADTPTIPIIFVSKGTLDRVMQELEESQRNYLAAREFYAKAGQTACLPDNEGNIDKVLFGLATGHSDFLSPLRPGELAKKLPAGQYHMESADGVDPRLAATAFAMASYRYDRYRAVDNASSPQLALDDAGMLAEIDTVNAGVTLARDLINTPANDLGPGELADVAASLAGDHGAEISIVKGSALLGAYPMIEAVGRGSDRSPRLIDMRWGDPKAPKVTLVGKGVIFDTGGLDIKPPSAMAIMKKDMGGAANVLGLAQMLMTTGPNIRLRVLIPAVENAISGRAFRPGDILRSRKGITVEIGNTDAEGRLVLADALAAADEEKPDLLVSMATLTGAARIGLGPDLPPAYCHHDDVLHRLTEAARSEADPFWRLPLWAEYDGWLSSRIADANHIGSTPFAGSIVAALFLNRFVDRSRPYVHFDIYAWNQKDRNWGPRGGEAQVIRGLYRAIVDQYPPA